MAVRFLPLALLLALTAGGPFLPAQAAESEEPWALDVFFLPAFPPFYDAMLGKVDDLHKICPGTPASDLKLYNNLLKLPGHLVNLLSFANAIDAGDNLDAAISGGLNGASLLLDVMGVQGMENLTVSLGAYSTAINLTVVGALVTSLQISYQSYKLAVQNETGRKIESLYGSIESDAHLKTPGRKLGEGEPIRKDAKAREYVWTRILIDSTWRELFQTYVVSELGQEWPQASTWESMRGVSPEAKIIEEERRLKGHILALLDQINGYAKAREAAVVAAKQMRELGAAGNGSFTPAQLQAALARAGEALKELPRAEEYANRGLEGKVKEFKAEIEKKDATARRILMFRTGVIPGEIKNLRGWARIIQGLPTRGKFGAQRDAILKKLEGGQKKLIALINSIPRDKIEELAKAEEKTIEQEALAEHDPGYPQAGVSEAATDNAVMKHFQFKRRKLERKYEDYAGEMRSIVENGEANEWTKSERIIQDARDAAAKLHGEYEADRLDHGKSEYLKKYDEVAEKLGRDMEAVNKDLERTNAEIAAAERASSSLYQRRSALLQQIEALNKEHRILGANLKAVMREVDLYAALDVGEANEIVQRLVNYAEVYRARFANVTALLQSTAADALARVGAFQPPFSLLSKDDVRALRELLNKAGTTYAGTTGNDYLKSKLTVDPASTPLTRFRERLKELRDVSKSYAEKVAALRIPLEHSVVSPEGGFMGHIAQLEKNVVPALQYIEKGEFARQRKSIEDALADAIRFIQDRHDEVPESFEASYEALMKNLEEHQAGAKVYTAAYLNPGVSSGEVMAFVKTAEENNRRVSDDLDYINMLYERFWKAELEAGRLVAGMIVASSSHGGDGSLPLLGSTELKEIMSDYRLDEIDAQANLGLGILLADPWAVTRTRERMVLIRLKELQDFHARLASVAPLSLFALIAEARKMSQGVDLLMDNRIQRGQECALQLKAIPEYAELGKKIDATWALKRKQAEDEHERENKERNAELMKIVELERELEMTRLVDAEARGPRLEQFRREMRETTKGFTRTTTELAVLDAKIDRYIQEAKDQAAERKTIDAVIRGKLDRLADAYRKREASGVLELFARDFRGGWENLRIQLGKDFGLFSSLVLTLQPMFVNAMGDRAEVEFEWRNESLYRKGGAAASRTGRSKLIFQSGVKDQWLIVDAEGDPFLGIGTDRVSAPQVVSHAPTQGQSNVPPSDQVTVDFSETMDAASISAALTIEPRTDVNLDYFGFNLTIRPRTSWPSNASIRVRLTREAMSAFGVPLDRELDFTFRTGDILTAPPPPPPAVATVSGNVSLWPFDGFLFSTQSTVNGVDPMESSDCDVFSWGGDALHGMGGAGLLDMGAGRLSSFTTAPESGYRKDLPDRMEIGHVYMVQTADMRYAKILVSNCGPHRQIVFRFVFQPDGTRILPGE